MKPGRIIVLGASGFVGTTLIERLRKSGSAEVIPVIHSAGSAWRLARFDAPLLQVDIGDKDALEAALAGATHVVNCTRGPRTVMIDGLRNILSACLKAGVRRFVHLSSVMVYGDPPPPESCREDGPAVPLPGSESYGLIKLEQDRMVQDAAKSGLPAVILCPPNISGPFSGYLAGIAIGMAKQSFALIDDGDGPCNLVDVRNLCHAIELAFEAEGDILDGRRIFVTDDGEPTWRRLTLGLMPLHEVEVVRRLARHELMALLDRASAKPRLSPVASLRHLVSSDVRAALRKDPLIAKLDSAARQTVTRLGRGLETRVRLGIEGHLHVPRADPFKNLALGLCAQQLRGVRHSNALAKSALGYRPAIDFDRSLDDFREWYRSAHGMTGPFWTLSRSLYS
jgi:nucleoside-diphosphate-sugar epimerase